MAGERLFVLQHNAHISRGLAKATGKVEEVRFLAPGV
jgi:hypothetical protein